MITVIRRFAPALTLLALAGPLAAQEFWPGPTPARFRFDIAKPSFDSEGDGFFTLSMLPSVRIPVGPVRITADFPFAFYSPESDDASQAIGNPWIGLEFGKLGGPFTFQAGARLPLADGEDDLEPLIVGAYSDWDHAEAWLPDVFSFGAAAVYESHQESGLVASARLGLNAISYSDDYWSDTDSDVMASYGVRIGYDRARVMVAAALTGRLMLTADDGEDSDLHQVGFEGGYRFGKVMPLLGLRVPLNGELKDAVNYVFTIGIKVTP